MLYLIVIAIGHKAPYLLFTDSQIKLLLIIIRNTYLIIIIVRSIWHNYLYLI